MSPRRFLAPFTRYKAYISPVLEPEYVDEEMIVVGVNTARSFAHGEGRINARQVARIVTRLASAAPSLIRIVVTHHPFDLPPGVSESRLLGRARMAMAQLAKADADLFLSGHLHLSHASHSAERYKIEGHSALIVQAGTVSERGRGESPSFNLLRVHRPEIELVRYTGISGRSRSCRLPAAAIATRTPGGSPREQAGHFGHASFQRPVAGGLS